MTDDGEKYVCGRGDEGVGEVVVGVVEFGLFFARADAEHGTWEGEQIVGKVF